MGFDLKKNNLADKAEAGYRFELTIPEVNTPTGAFVTVRGKEADVVKKYARKRFAEIQFKENAQRNRNRNGEASQMTIEEAEDLAVDTAYVRIISWEGFEEDGEPLEFNEANGKKVLKDHPWIRDQIITESDMLVNFIK